VGLAGININNQQFGLVYDTYDAINNSSQANGILGLAYPDASSLNDRQQISSIPFHMANNGLLLENVFSIHTSSIYTNGWSGQLVLGGYNASQFTGNLNYVPVVKTSNNYTLWQINTQSIQLVQQHQQVIVMDQQTPIITTIDTGTTFSYMDNSFIQPLIQKITGQTENILNSDLGCYPVDCSLASSPSSNSTIDFIFNKNTRLSIPLNELIEPIDYTDLKYAKQCVFSICPWNTDTKQKRDGPTNSASSAADSTILLGDSFIRSFYIVFDMGNNQLGFAPSLDSNSTVTSL
jgi:hypothetical protein